jgi:two-component system response regulator
MNNTRALPPVLMADDDPDDCSLAVEAFKLASLHNPLLCMGDGEALIIYLRRCMISGDFNCFPALILLDLNMPRMDGRETLQTLKSDPSLQPIPVVVWTTSRADDDRNRARVAGCDGYFIKPSSFSEMVRIVRSLGERWLENPQISDTSSQR